VAKYSEKTMSLLEKEKEQARGKNREREREKAYSERQQKTEV